MSIFEAIMLICFGAAWPVSIVKSWKSRSAEGKSLGFLVILILGYISGITHKLLYSHDIVLVLYVSNLVLVTTDLSLYFRNKALDRQRTGKI